MACSPDIVFPISAGRGDAFQLSTKSQIVNGRSRFVGSLVNVD